jgi:nucleotide-binding universal stress UspA family protein
VRKSRRRPRPIVVGVNGAAQGIDAAIWAGRDAQRRGATVELIHVCRCNSISVAAAMNGVYVDPRVHDDGAEAVAEATRALRVLFPGVPVSGRVCLGDVGSVLGTFSRNAEAIVIGSHRTGSRFRGSGVARLARCSSAPVVVVSKHLRVRTRVEPATSAVVVVLESRHGAEEVLAWACRHARRERCPIRVQLGLRRSEYGRTERHAAECWLFDLLVAYRAATVGVHLSGAVAPGAPLDGEAPLSEAPLVVVGGTQRNHSVRRWAQLVDEGDIRALALVPTASSRVPGDHLLI